MERIAMRSGTLSNEAITLLCLHAEHGGHKLTDENREAHRELAKEGLMVPVHSFSGGRERCYRLTDIMS